ncbi:MAG TPA: hypothetical protein VF407_03180 [Polyangiaceae bacterium]
MAKYVAFLVGVAGPLCVPSVAHAQAWLADRRYQEGEGIRPGDGDIEIHPGVGAEVGYDSNWFQRSNKDGPGIVNAAPAAPIESSGVLKITPSVSIRSLGSQRKQSDSANAAPPTVAFSATASGTYEEFIFAPSDLRDQRNMSVNAAARLDILPQHPVGFSVYGNYSRAINPNRGNPDVSFNSDTIGGGAELVLVPGGGTLDWRFGYGLTGTIFESSEGTPYNNLTHNFYTKGRWGFRPRTSLLYDANFQVHDYGDASNAVNALHNATPLRTHIGIDGLVSPRFSVLALVGYGSTFTLNGASPAIKQYDSVIGQAELKFFLTANPSTEQASNVSLTLASISLGYNRDFQTSYLGDYYGIDRGYAKVQYMFAGRVLASLEGGVGAIEYPDIYYNTGTGDALAHTAFTDVRADGTLFGEYRFSNTFGLNGTLRYTANFSDTQLQQPTVNGVPGGVYDMNWRRFEAYLGVRWFL